MNSRVDILVNKIGERSILSSAFFTPPCKVLDITEDKKCPCLHLMLMSTSPGILDGDQHNLNLVIEPHARLSLRTQGYQRIFDMKHGATQKMNVELKEGSQFSYIPHPTVPHQRSVLKVENNFHLHPTSQLVFGEVISCGRKHSGESFLFTKYHSLAKIYIGHKLVLRENLLLEPVNTNFAGTGMLEGYSHQANLFIMGPFIAAQEKILPILNQANGIDFGITELFPGCVIVRMLGNGAEQLHQILITVKEVISPV